MLCDYQCFMIGGPWIAENPKCPVHGADAVAKREAIENGLRDILTRVWYREISADDGYNEIDDLLNL